MAHSSPDKTDGKNNSEDSIVGYLHNLSPIKTSQNKNQYFHLKFQTSTDVYHTVCFSSEKHTILKRKFESSSPVKLNRFQFKKNQKTGEDELIMNKRTKIEEPSETETDFDFQSIKADVIEAKPSSAEEVLDGDINILVNLSGCISFNGATETLNVKGKALRKQEAQFTDNTGSVRLVLWENDIQKVQSRQCYHLTNVAVKEYDDTNYLTFTRNTTLKTVNLTIQREDTVTSNTSQLEVAFPPDGINYVQHFLSCNKCHSKVADNENNIIKCTECALVQLKSKCQKKIIASVLSINDKETMSLIIFDDIIEQLYTLCKEQGADIDKQFKELTDDDVTEILLTVEATVLFNDKKNAVKVVKS